MRASRPWTKRRAVILLVTGGLFLAIPLILVLAMGNPLSCPSGREGICASSGYYFVIDILPYPMLAGALMIAYDLKRISDSLLPEEEEDS